MRLSDPLLLYFQAVCGAVQSYIVYRPVSIYTKLQHLFHKVPE